MYKTSLIQCICRLILLSVLLYPAITLSQFTITPDSQTALEGDSVIFRCKADNNNDDLTYAWLLNGIPLKITKRVYQNESNLHILNVNKNTDAGEYVCIAHSTSTGAREATTSARLDVLWLTTPVVQLLNANQNSYILRCHVDGNGDIAITWFRDEEILERSQHFDWNRKKLYIKNATPEQNGIYACGATNKAGFIVSTKNYRLKLRDISHKRLPAKQNHKYSKSECSTSATTDQHHHRSVKLCRGKRGGDNNVIREATNIEFVKHPSDATIHEGHFVILDCLYKTSTGNKNQTIRWRKDGAFFRHLDLSKAAFEGLEKILGRDHSRVLINKENGSLVFNHTQAGDAGVYDCVITNNEDGSERNSNAAKLTVIAMLKFNPKPVGKTLELGSVGKIHCKAQGTPAPEITWYKDGKPELPSSASVDDGTLVFEKVTFDQQGEYTCIATNSQGRINSTVTVNVAVAPQFTLKPPENLQVSELDIAVLHCQASGVPTPTIRWDKDLKPLPNNETDLERFEILNNGTLIIKEVHLEDEGKYGCIIGSSAGLKRQDSILTVRPSFLPIDGVADDGFVITRAVLITLSVAATYIILVITLMIWCRRRRQSRKLRLNGGMKENGDLEGEIKMAETEPCLPVEKERTNGSAKKANGKVKLAEEKGSDDTNSTKSKKSTSSVLDQYSIPRSGLSELITIGRGDFGDVLIGKVRKLDLRPNGIKEETQQVEENEKNSKEELNEIKEESDYRLVLVKALNKVKDEGACAEFRRQIDLFRQVTSRSVTRLYGLCREKDPHYLVLEYTDWGDLKQFLLATSDQISTSKLDTKPPPLLVPQIITLAHQIGRGMDAIYKAKLIHKDLATRNCLITSRFTAKISMPGLSKDKYSKEYFKHRNQLIPLRWLAPECLSDDDYSIKSDVFAFAVVVWEIFTQAVKVPHEEIPNETYLSLAQNGKLEWKLAEQTPEQLKKILLSCWSTSPKERPSFSQLVSALGGCLQSEYPKNPDDK